MTATTSNSMNLLIQKNSKRINAKVPEAMKQLIVKAARELNMSESQFIKVAVAEKLDRLK